MKRAFAVLVVFYCLVIGFSVFAASIYYEDRNGNSGTFTPAATWDDLQTAMTNAVKTPTPPATQRGIVMVTTGLISRTAHTQSALTLTSAANHSMVTISGGWEWNGGAKPVVQSGRTTLDANSGALDTVNPAVAYNGLKDCNHFTINDATNVILDSMVLVNGRPQMDWPGGRTAEGWGSSIRIVRGHYTTLTNLVVASNDLANFEGVIEPTHGGSIAVLSELSENTIQLMGFRMTGCELHHNGENDSYATGVHLRQVGDDSTPAIIEHCNFHENRGHEGVAVVVTSTTDNFNRKNRVVISNCRIWGNRAAQVVNVESSTPINYTGGDGSYDTRTCSPSTRVTLFGSLIEGNYSPVATWVEHPILNYSEGLTGSDGFAIVNSTVVSNYNTAGGWGRIQANVAGSSSNCLWMINSISAIQDGPRLALGAKADLQATTFGNGPVDPDFAAQTSGGDDVWPTLASAMTQQDSDAIYRYNNRNDTTGARETTVQGSNKEAGPGFLLSGGDPYQLQRADQSSDALLNTVDLGIYLTESGMRFVDVNFDGDYDAGWDIVVAGTTNSGGTDLIYTKDLLGNDRVRKGKIDRGAYESEPPPPLPLITSSGPTNVTTSSAAANGFLASTGGAPTVVYIYWGDEDAGTGPWDNGGNWPPDFWDEGSYPKTNLTGLAGDDTHYYVFAATNSYGTNFSAVQNFITGEVTVQNTGNGSEIGPVDGEFTVSRPASCVDEALTVNYYVDLTVADAAAPAGDYTALPGSVVIPAGNQSATIPVSVIPDLFSEPVENVRLVITNGYYAVGSPPSSATVSITNKPSSAGNGNIWWRSRDGASTGTFESAWWDDVRLAIDRASAGAAGTGRVKISGDVAREDAVASSIWVTNRGNVLVSGGWNWPGGLTEPDTQTGRSTLDVDQDGLGDNERVMTITGTPSITLDALVITGGEAPTGPISSDPRGGGIFAADANSLVITNCRVTGNRTPRVSSAGNFGGGLWVRRWNFANVTGFRMTDCVIDNNRNPGSHDNGLPSPGDNNGDGGGLYLYYVGTAASPAIIEGTTFRDNYAEYGSAVYGLGTGNPCVLANCTIVSNDAVTVVHGEENRVAMFGSLVADNSRFRINRPIFSIYYNTTQYTPDSPADRLLIAANCTIVSNVFGAPSTPGQAVTYQVQLAGYQRNLRFINSIYAGEYGVYLGRGTGAERTIMQTMASTYDVGHLRANHPGGTDNWPDIMTALTTQDSYSSPLYRYRNLAFDGTEETNEIGSNTNGTPGFAGAGVAMYSLPIKNQNPDTAAHSADLGVMWTNSVPGQEFYFIDMDRDATYDAMTDIIVGVTDISGLTGSHLMYTKDLLGNPRVAGKSGEWIDRGAYESLPPPPPGTIIIVR